MGSGIEEHQDFIFCFKGETPGLHGVGFLIKKEYKNNILSFSGLSERVAILQLEFNKKIISIIQVYAPTEKASKEEMEKFYESLQEAQAQTSGDVLLMGDFNAKVGIAKTKEDKILGKFGYGKRNERGEKLIEFAFEHKLSIMNTYFKMRQNRKWTWKSPNGKVKNELDYILSNQPKSIRKIEVLHGLGYSSDHRLVRATYSLQNTKKRRISFKSSPNIFKTEKEIMMYTRNLENNIKELEPFEDDDVQTLYNKIEHVIKKSISTNEHKEEQSFSTLDHIHVMEQIIEKYKEFNRPIYIGFIDYAKAFDTISHDAIWEALDKCQVHDKYKNVLKNIYDKSTSCVKLENRGPEIPILRGVRQGDPLSPKIFIAVLHNIFEELKWKNEGLKICNQYLSHLRFADDIVLLADNSRKLEKMINQLNVQSKRVGLLMNKDKTKVMTNSVKHPIKLEGKTLEFVNKYIYLGKEISFEDRSEEEEVQRRINMSWKKYWSLKEIMKGDYPLHLKKTVMDTCILPTLTYGCQSWTFNTTIKTKMVNCQKAMERSILKIKIKIKDKVRSEFIRNKTKLIDVLNFSKRLKWRWAGHVARYSDKRWTNEVTKWKGPNGKRRKGRPMKRWSDDIIVTAGKEWMRQARNRENWIKLEEAYTQIGVPVEEN
ncbi:uncharacterized protein LOC119629720 [Bombyx mori]|uniref:Reverse transcriptase domain-containing protein n=1 Tax=Bombyx mori TaxID=7091 RepID=A0A8R2M2D8_BOMMO|nr:uncharacterized protein LOC119629720 [Bombyx mori]